MVLAARPAAGAFVHKRLKIPPLILKLCIWPLESIDYCANSNYLNGQAIIFVLFSQYTHLAQCLLDQSDLPQWHMWPAPT